MAADWQSGARAKGAGDENFPVGSRLIARRHRGAVLRYYAFARAADDVADDPALAPAEKLRRLDAFEAALDGADGPAVATDLRRCLAERRVDDRHARDLLVAFRRDAAGLRCADRAELADYCAHSAHPVGRFMLALHREPPRLRALSDPICAALQILNHLQDFGDDYRKLGRIYLPGSWLRQAGVAERELAGDRLTPGLRQVMERTLDATDTLIARGADLPAALRSDRLAGEVAATLALARRLSARLRAGDPLRDRVALSRVDFTRAALAGLGTALRRSRPSVAREAA